MMDHLIGENLDPWGALQDGQIRMKTVANSVTKVPKERTK